MKTGKYTVIIYQLIIYLFIYIFDFLPFFLACLLEKKYNFFFFLFEFDALQMYMGVSLLIVF